MSATLQLQKKNGVCRCPGHLRSRCFVLLALLLMQSAMVVSTSGSGIIRLVEPVRRPPSIAASCFSPSVDSAQFQACRSVGFCWQRNASSSGGHDNDDGFLDQFVATRDADSAASLGIFVSAHVVLQGPSAVGAGSVATVPAYTPFDLASLFPRVLEGLSVWSNGTCLRIVFPMVPLDIPASVAASMRFDLSHPWLYVRGLEAVLPSERLQLATSFAVWVNHSAPEEPLDAYPILTVVNAVLGAATLLTCPLASALPEAAIGILAAHNGCMQPNIREPSDAVSLWALTPLSGPVLSSFEALWRSMVVLVVVPVLHAGATVVAYLRLRGDIGTGHAAMRTDMDAGMAPQRASKWRRAMQKARFPSLSVGWCFLMFAPLSYASVAVLRDAVFAAKYEANRGVLGILLSIVVLLSLVVVCAAPPILLRYTDIFYLRRERLVTKAMCVLPDVVRMVLPGAMWGPTQRIRDWELPFTPCRERRVRWCTLQWGAVVVIACVFVPWPHEAPPCVGQYAIGGVLCFAYAAVVVKTMPYRGKVLCGAIPVQAVCLAIALVMNASRCAGTYLVLPNQGIQTLLTLYHSVGIARSALTAVCGVVEASFVRHMVWPPLDDVDGDDAAPCEGVQSVPEPEERLMRSSGVGSRLDGSGSGASVDGNPQSRTDAATSPPVLVDVPRHRQGTNFPTDGGVYRDERSTHVAAKPLPPKPLSPVDDGGASDDDFFVGCRKRRERAEEELNMATAYAQKQRRKSFIAQQAQPASQLTSKGSGSRPRSHCAPPLPAITHDALLKEPMCWLNDAANTDDSLIRMVARQQHQGRSEDAMQSPEATHQLLEAAQSARSRAMLRGPMVMLLQGDALHPPSVDAHLQRAMDML